MDDISDECGAEFAAFPERLYVLDENLRILYKGGVGPDGYKPDEIIPFL